MARRDDDDAIPVDFTVLGEDGLPLGDDDDLFVELAAFCLSETPLAIKVQLDDKVQWVPKSLILPDSEVRDPGDSGWLMIPEWFAIKEGLV